MKCLKADDYVQRMLSVKDTEVLHNELKKFVNDGLSPSGRTACDRIIRACNQRLGAGALEPEHLERLVDLVELAVQGYGLVTDPRAPGCPFYLEKIIFHILQKMVTQGAHGPASRLGEIMYIKLQGSSTEAEDFTVLVRNCFAVLWNGLLPSGPGASSMPPRDRLRWKLQALLFRLLEDTAATSPSPSRVPLFVEEALGEYEQACGGLSRDDGAFFLSELRTRFLGPLIAERAGGDSVLPPASLAGRCQVVLKVCRVLCKSGLWPEAEQLVCAALEVAGHMGGALGLAVRAVQLHRALRLGEECSRTFTDCARVLRGCPPAGLGDAGSRVLLEACQLVVWATEAGQTKGMGGASLLTCFSFLEEYQELLLKHQQSSFSPRLQYSLCFGLYQGFISTYDSLRSSQDSLGDSLDRVLLYCQATLGCMMNELRKLSNDAFLLKSVCAVNNVVYELFNRKLYEEAFRLAEIVCQELSKDCPASLPVDRVNRCFMLVVQSSRRASRLETALDWVVRWIQVLGVRVLDHLVEPVSLWVRTKCDATRAGEEDTRLRTLRDGLGASCGDEEVLTSLLEEELRLYKEQTGDTAQERYNTLCDLLDICHEDTTHTLRRASYLCEMAQVVCYQDFSQQTDCSAVDFTHEALRLLEEEPETAENADRLKDEKAHASLWFYICTLEAKLQEALDTEKRLRAVQEGSRCAGSLEPVPTNDLEYEDKQKLQDSQLVYDGLRFSLAEHTKHCEPLNRCLSLWGALLKQGTVPAVREPKRTASSLLLAAALCSLMAKPLEALRGYRLAASLLRLLGDGQTRASALCHTAKVLLDLGAPQLAQVQLEQAELCLAGEADSEGTTIMSVTTRLLRAHLCYSLGEVERGLSSLCDVLKETAQRHSKSWYLLKAQALQCASVYLSLDTHTLPTHLRQAIVQHGVKTPDTAQYEALKLLCSLVMMLLGNGFYGAPAPAVETRFVDQGDSVLFKWLLLSEVLLCSERVVCVRSSAGSAHEAKAQCLEALKLATKLHTFTHCAEMLVLKAELELMKGANDASALDLEQVRNLLDVCTDFGNHHLQKSELKIKPRKGRPAAQTSACPTVEEEEEEEDLCGLLSSRALGREPVEALSGLGQDASPPLKPKRQRVLACLTHAQDCSCPCCHEPGLGRVAVRWALAQANLRDDWRISHRLRHLAKLRCRSVTDKLRVRLAALVSAEGPDGPGPAPSLLKAELGMAHLGSVLMQLRCGAEEKGQAAALWEEIEAGLEAVEPKGVLCPELAPLRAALLGAKAEACLLTLAGKRQCSPDDLFSSAWGWSPPLVPVAPMIKMQSKPRTEVQTWPKCSGGDELLPAGGSSAKNLPDGSRVASLEQSSKKTKEAPASSSKKAKDSGSKVSTAKHGMVFKTPRATRTPRPKSTSLATPADIAGDLSAFDFTNEVPDIATPLRAFKAMPGSRGAARAKIAPKGSFQVFEDTSPTQEKPVAVPAAPKRTKRSRFKVDFSDESETETAPPAVMEKSEKKRSVSSTSKTPSARKPARKVCQQAEEQDQPRRLRGGKQSTALCPSGPSSEDEPNASTQTRSRPQRPRRGQSSKDLEQPEKMRMIKEDEGEGALDVSLEDLQESETLSGSPTSGPVDDFEVLRRDLGADLSRDCVNELRTSAQLGVSTHAPLPHTHTAAGELSIDVVKSLLWSSWLLLHHFPSPALYPHVCSQLVQLLGLTDPITTAMLHAESLGVSTRHHMTRHLATRLRKLKKSGGDVTAGLSALSLEESSSQWQTKTLRELESIYSFTSTQPTHFPHTHCQEFTRQLGDLPAGLTVCLLSLAGVCPGEVGSTVLFTRLERGSAPVTIRIPTAHTHRSMAALLEEMEAVLQGQKQVSGVADKVQWWEGRKALDARVQKLLEEMEEALGVWRALLLPLTSDPALLVHLKCFEPLITGTKVTLDMLKVVLSAAPLLTVSDLQSLAQGACLLEGNFLKQLQKSVFELRGREKPKGHTVLILDKYLQRLPWENIPCLKPRSVTRMPSLHSVLGHSHLQEVDPDSVQSCGVDPKQVYFVLNPDGNLPETEKRFRDWFTSEPVWQGVCGSPPDPEQLQEAVSTKDLYIYVGHGAGARFLDAQRLQRGRVRAVALLFGCSSAALSVQGCLEGTGIIFSYLLAGCPLVLGNLWDVTDRDIDRFTSALLQSWLTSGSGSSLSHHLVQSRDATHLKHIIGAAPIAYGLPVHLR
ncbi:separin [Brachyhypopomus gauderio]|uniref:separin n=1 Tax=Brachyhypopomus gauderio TaxID=698409 RepID=UPI00404239E8